MNAQSALESPDPGSLLGGERKVLEMIAAGAPLETILDALCRVIDEQSGLRSSIFLLDTSAERLTLAAGPHLPDVWRTAVASFPVTVTACGAAVTRRQQIVSSDIGADPLYADLRDAAEAAGIRAVWSTPFFSEHERPLGTFAVYSGVCGPPSAFNLELVGRATHLASIAVERHLIEEGRRESERLLAEAQRLAQIGSWSWNLPNGKVTWSDELYRIFAVERGEFEPGREAMGFVHPDDRETIRNAIDQTLKTREPYSFTYRIHRRDGSERVLHSQGRLVTDGHGEPVTIFGSTQDITERKLADEALRRSEQRLRLVLEAIPVGVVVVDPGGNVILSNPTVARIWGELVRPGPERYARSKAWWHDTKEAVKPDEWASRRALANGETSINEIIDIEAFDGTRKVIRNSAVPIRDEHREIVGAVIVNEDISARKAAEQKLEASVSQMQTLATRLMHAQDDERRRIARMLHETTAQDLAALKMLLARLNRTCERLSDADRALLTESVQLADRSMTEIRTLAYLLHPPFLDETGLLSALRWYAQGFADRSGIRVDLDLPDTVERLPQDVETTLFRVVQEALINIHRHAGSPTARIRLRAGADRLTLEVEDHGRGMAPDFVARLRGGVGAIGVGLAGMRERLQQLGGTLDLESDGRGTVVRAAVPVQAVAS